MTAHSVFDSFDLRALTTIGLQLPIPDQTLNAIRDMQASGLIVGFESEWKGPVSAPTDYAFHSEFKKYFCSRPYC